MTGRQKIEAALSPGGTPEIPAVICYEGICIRDHWEELTSYPWWYRQSPDLHHQMLWHRETIEKIGQDWFRLPDFCTAEERQRVSIEARPEGVFQTDRRTGREERLTPPQVGGWSASGGLHSAHPDHMPETPEEIDALVPVPSASGVADPRRDGSADLAEEMLKAFGRDRFPIGHVASPLWCCYDLWGFEGMMIRVATRPDLVEHVCRRSLMQSTRSVHRAAALGAAGIWIEECLTDMVSAEAFERLNLPHLVRLVDEIRAAGMKSIYYFCGNPEGKWDLLLEAGADALSLEESKKGFSIDIEETVARVQGRCAVLGNLDAVGVLQDGNDPELRSEISRQIEAGRRNGNRFVMSLGSPVTPGTSMARVRSYCDLAHEIGTA